MLALVLSAGLSFVRKWKERERKIWTFSVVMLSLEESPSHDWLSDHKPLLLPLRYIIFVLIHFGNEFPLSILFCCLFFPLRVFNVLKLFFTSYPQTPLRSRAGLYFCFIKHTKKSYAVIADIVANSGNSGFENSLSGNTGTIDVHWDFQ